jgi:hypothetical protein
LVCDCRLEWLLVWLNDRPNALSNTARTRCVLPISLAETPIKKVSPQNLHCPQDGTEPVVTNAGPNSPPILVRNNARGSSGVTLSPNQAQVVFEGDSLDFQCTATNHGLIQWLINGNPVSLDNDLIRINQGQGISVLSISSLQTAFKGQVACISGVEGGDSISSAVVDVLVLAKDSPVCSPIVLDTSRGQYRWGAAISGLTVSQWCQRKPNYQSEAAAASLQCRPTGEWAATVNVSQCAYTSDVTDTLHKFATMNTSFTMNTLLESAKHFLNYTGNPRMFQNPMDLVYFSQVKILSL